MSIEDFVGQERVKNKIKILITKGKLQKKMPHIGIWGPTGTGKTMLAYIIAEELDAHLIYMNGTVIKDPVAFLYKVYEAKKSPDRLHSIFIDEAHRLSTSIQNNLLSVLEEPGTLCCASPFTKQYPTYDKNGNFLEHKKIRRGDPIEVIIPTNVFFIFSSDQKGDLALPVLNRVEDIDLDEYTKQDALNILAMNKQIEIPNRFLSNLHSISRNIRDLKQKLGSLQAYVTTFQITPNHLTDQQFQDFCYIEGIDEDGLTTTDRSYLMFLNRHDRIGLNSISTMLGVSVEEVANTIEPWLLKKNFIKLTPRGRELTSEGMRKIGVKDNEDGQSTFSLRSS